MRSLAKLGEDVSELEPVELSKALEACWRQILAESAQLTVESEAILQADPTRLQQLLENLLGNAIEHGGAGSITVGDIPHGFYVEDTGPGSPERARRGSGTRLLLKRGRHRLRTEYRPRHRECP